ncbi:hypothetical protein AcW2_005241 [Taiwanofungus camphoratus]|nr:hypothetical protein AcW2_005241 [Antrodia cinnamomea]
MKSVVANFPVPIYKYVLDGRGELSIQPSATTPSPFNIEKDPCGPAHQVHPLKRPLSTDDTPQSDRRPRKKTRTDNVDLKSKLMSPAHVDTEPISKLRSIKARKVPEVDLRKLSARVGKKAAVFKYQKIHDSVSKKEENSIKTPDFWSSLTESTRSLSRISVSVALRALQAVSTSKATQFKPGSQHLGKEFRCLHTASTISPA